MAVTCTLSNHYKYAKAKKLIDLSADSIKACLMRSGFVFDKDVHATKINFKTNSGSIASLTFDNTANTLTRGPVPLSPMASSLECGSPPTPPIHPTRARSRFQACPHWP